MEDKLFDISNFNIIQDEKNYYVFRALNRADSKDIIENVTSDENGIKRIRTDRERWNQENIRKARYTEESTISLEEVWNHIRINYSKETNCISLSTNSNVIIDYGKGYNQEYVMVKVPKENAKNIYFAGKYMLEELDKIIDDEIAKLPENSPVIKLLNDVEHAENSSQVVTIVGEVFNKAKTSGKYIGTNIKLENRLSVNRRFDRKQYFNEEQQKKYNKIVSKLTILEMHGKLRNVLPRTSDNISLLSTIGGAFSSGELIHYKDIQSNELTQVSKEMMDVISLFQQVKNDKINNDKVKSLEKKIIEAINNGMTFSDITDTINSQEKSIEEMYRLTDGKIEYEKARVATEFAKRLMESRIKTANYIAQMKKKLDSNNEYQEVFDIIEKKGFVINQSIINRENNFGKQIADSVNIGLDKNDRRFLNVNEQEQIISQILNLNIDELSANIKNDDYYKKILEKFYNDKETITENRYFAEAIIDSLDLNKIYKNAIKEKKLSIEEREILISKLEEVNCKKLYEAFKNKNIQHNEIAGYIINLLMNNGYKGYSLKELSDLSNLGEIIDINIENTMLKNKISAFRFDELLGIRDNDYEVEGSNIKLRDYQKDAVDKIEKIIEDKRFAGVVLPTGAGKSFVAITEMLKYKDKNILYFAPQTEILNQIQRHIIKNVLNLQILTEDEIKELNGKKAPDGKIYPNEIKEHIEKVFPHLKMYCYQSLSQKNDETMDKELRNLLKNSDADLIIFDELHRAGANTWEPLIKELLEKNKKSKTLGITATPIRDVDKKDMMRTIAEMTGEYSKEELVQKQYLASEMYLIDAIQEHLVIEPQIVTFSYSLRESDEYKEVEKMISEEKDEQKKEQLNEILEEMNNIINDTTDLQTAIISEKDPEKRQALEIQYEEIRKKINKGTNTKKNQEEIWKVIKQNLKKQDGRYIIFLPQNNTNNSTEEYVNSQIQQIKEYIKDIDENPEISYLLSNREGGKAGNNKAIADFEDSNSKHLKLLLAIDMLNEGVHIDGINGEIMLRKIGEGSKILYLQQLGRVIFSIDPENQISKEDLPIVYDVHNNWLTQNMNKVVNKQNSTSDLQRLQSAVNWIRKHEYFPDINSEAIEEARKAIILKKIQLKYGKYLDGFDKYKLSQTETYEIQKILELSNSINLFNMEIPKRIVPPGEKELGEVSLFKISGEERRFSDLYKNASKITGKREQSNKIRLKKVLSVLETLSEYDIEINNETIPNEVNLIDFIKKQPENLRSILLEEIDMPDDYKIGEEYDFAKESFRNKEINKIFLDYDIRELRKYGIFEQEYWRKVVVNDFIQIGPKAFIGVNIKTGTVLDEEGYYQNGWNEDGICKSTLTKYDVNGYDKEGYDKDGYNKYNWNRDGINKITKTLYNLRGFDRNGINKDTVKVYNNDYFDNEGYYYIDGENGERVKTCHKYNLEGFNCNHEWREDKHKRKYNTDPFGIDFFGEYHEDEVRDRKLRVKIKERKEKELEEAIKRIEYEKKEIEEKKRQQEIEKKRQQELEEARKEQEDKKRKFDENGICPTTNRHFDENLFNSDGINVITSTQLNLLGFNYKGECLRNGGEAITKDGFDINGMYVKNNSQYNERGLNAYGINQEGQRVVYNKYGNIVSKKIPDEIIFAQDYINTMFEENSDYKTVLTKIIKKHKNLLVHFGEKKITYSTVRKRTSILFNKAAIEYPKIKELLEERLKNVERNQVSNVFKNVDFLTNLDEAIER